MRFFANGVNAIKGATSAAVSAVKTAGYAVTGAAVVGTLVVGMVVTIPADEAIKSMKNLPQIPGRVVDFFALDSGFTASARGVPGFQLIMPGSIREDSPAAGGHIVGQARFQVITPSLIRVEYAEDDKFENRPTMLAFNRNVVPPAYAISDDGKVFTIKTSKLNLTYIKNSGPFGDGNLKISFNDGAKQNSVSPRWLPSGYTPDPSSWGALGYLKNVSSDSHNTPRTTGNLGGWYRSLDSQSDAVPLHDGLLSRDGYYFIDDSKSAVIAGPDGYESRPFHTARWKPGYLSQKSANALSSVVSGKPDVAAPLRGVYQDGYFFAYGDDYKSALKDYRVLSGAAPLLPRKAFGVWFSRYYPYTDAQIRNELFPAFRSERVPLDVLAIDTDAKAPVAWNGWQWNNELLPNPKDTIRWMHDQGVDVLLNTHPSISAIDPKFSSTLDKAGPGLLRGGGFAAFFQWGTGLLDGSRQKFSNVIGVPFVFDFQKSSHIRAYMDLHGEFEKDGIDGFWLDWCCDDSSVGGQINKGEFAGDTWINQQYAQRNVARGSRWLPLARSGGSFQDWHGNRPGPWGAQRSTIHFTGDTVATWPMLSFQARFSAAQGAVGMPYVSHDVGGFQTAVLIDTNKPYDEELYLRWVQLSVFQPILRLHSSSKSGSQRLPWEFTGRTRALSADFLRMRGALVPYLYTAAREAHDTGLPMTRAMYLDWPKEEAAYKYDRQYMLGSQLLVAPVGTPADKSSGLSEKKVWFPPGCQWVDIFTGEVYQGGTEVTVEVPLERMPVFAKAGAVVPMAPYMDYSGQKPLDNLVVSLFSGQDGEFSLYEDDGVDNAYLQSSFSWTRFAFNQAQKKLSIAAPIGRFKSQVGQRAYQLKVMNATQPRMVMVSGRVLPVAASVPEASTPGWHYEAASQTLHVMTPKLDTQQAQVIEFR